MVEGSHPPGRRFSPAMIGWGSAGVVVIVVVVLVLVAVSGGTKANVKKGPLDITPAVLAKVTAVPASVLDEVGIAGNPASSNTVRNPLNVASGARGVLPAVDGKPAFFFYGAEWCPYCATERWAIIVALSRFGTFQDLGGAYSSPTDAYPDTQTFTFHGSLYKSAYLTFLHVEVENMNKLPLESPSSLETGVLTAWDPALLFPFVDIGGRYVGGLPEWDNPQLLAGLTRAQIAQMLWEPTNPVGDMIDANANYLTAAICTADGARPARVCLSRGVQAAAGQLESLPNAVPLT